MNMLCIDLDGTLEDSRLDMVAVARRLRRRLGLFNRSDEDILPWVNKGMDQLYRACFGDYIQETDRRFNEVKNLYEADYLANVAVETRLYPGIHASLKAMKEFGPIIVVTNKPEQISRRLLEVLGVDQTIQDVIGGDTCSKTKPDPSVLEEAAKRCGLNGLQAASFMIGDTAADIKMGKAFGAKTIWCRWGYADHPGQEPDFVAEEPEQLPDIIQRFLRRSLLEKGARL